MGMDFHIGNRFAGLKKQHLSGGEVGSFHFSGQEMDEILARCREAEAQSSIGPWSQAGEMEESGGNGIIVYSLGPA